MKNKLGRLLLLITGLLALGTVGYHWIEGWSLDEALYMTVITITTTGYQEVNPLTPQGRYFTIFLLAAGVSTIALATNTLFHEIVMTDREALRRKKMLKKISKLKGHTIVCGFGRMGKIVCEELKKAGEIFVVVDKVSQNFEQVPNDYLWIQGDAADDELLYALGIDRARSLASMVDSDSDSLYLTLAARSLNPDIEITARYSHPSAAVKLKRAGANNIIQPLQLSAEKVAGMILSSQRNILKFPIELSFADAPDKFLARISMEDQEAYWDKPIGVFEEKEGVVVAGLLDSSGDVLPRPDGSTKITRDHIFLTLKSESFRGHQGLIAS